MSEYVPIERHSDSADVPVASNEVRQAGLRLLREVFSGTAVTIENGDDDASVVCIWPQNVVPGKLITVRSLKVTCYPAHIMCSLDLALLVDSLDVLAAAVLAAQKFRGSLKKLGTVSTSSTLVLRMMSRVLVLGLLPVLMPTRRGSVSRN